MENHASTSPESLRFSYGGALLRHQLAWSGYLLLAVGFFLLLAYAFELPVSAVVVPIALVLVLGIPHALYVGTRVRREPSGVEIDGQVLRVAWANNERTFPLRDVRVAVAAGDSFMDALVLRRALEFHVHDGRFIVFSFIGGYDRLCRALTERGLLKSKTGGTV